MGQRVFGLKKRTSLPNPQMGILSESVEFLKVVAKEWALRFEARHHSLLDS